MRQPCLGRDSAQVGRKLLLPAAVPAVRRRQRRSLHAGGAVMVLEQVRLATALPHRGEKPSSAVASCSSCAGYPGQAVEQRWSVLWRRCEPAQFGPGRCRMTTLSAPTRNLIRHPTGQTVAGRPSNECAISWRRGDRGSRRAFFEHNERTARRPGLIDIRSGWLTGGEGHWARCCRQCRGEWDAVRCTTGWSMCRGW